jgi:3-oxoacyl-[acyl-carrier protein] reductase
LITGASRGIGLGVARLLVAAGARVTITGRNAEALAGAVAELGGASCALAVAGRADDAAHAGAAVDATIAEFGRLDLLVNNAGVSPFYGRLLDIEASALRKTFEVNLYAALEWTRVAHGAWMGEHGGAVVNVSSISALRTMEGLGAYGVSKAALSALTAQLAVELAPRVRVNAVAPAVVRTRMAGALYEGREEQVAAGYPMGRLGVPADVAGLVAFLLSEEASWITGQTVIIDGGVTLPLR